MFVGLVFLAAIRGPAPIEFHYTLASTKVCDLVPACVPVCARDLFSVCKGRSSRWMVHVACHRGGGGGGEDGTDRLEGAVFRGCGADLPP